MLYFIFLMKNNENIENTSKPIWLYIYSYISFILQVACFFMLIFILQEKLKGYIPG